MPVLRENIYSVFHNKKEPILYAKKGTKVEIIARLGDVLIVKAKQTFPVHKSKIDET